MVVDEQASIRQLCATIARSVGLVAVEAAHGSEALKRLAEFTPDLLLTELNFGAGSGMDLLLEVKSRIPRAEVALMCAIGSSDSALEAMRMGAYDFVIKPFRLERMRLMLLRMAEKVRLKRENEFLRSRLSGAPLPALCTDLAELERITMEHVLMKVDGDKDRARRLLGISRATLYRKIKRYGLPATARNPLQAKLKQRDSPSLVLSQS
jgi:DNA-binding NtrC family response regulator